MNMKKIIIIIGAVILVAAAVFVYAREARIKSANEKNLIEMKNALNDQKAKIDEQQIKLEELEKTENVQEEKVEAQETGLSEKDVKEIVTDITYCQSGANAYTKKAYESYKVMAEEAREGCEESNDRMCENDPDCKKQDCDELYKKRKKTSDQFKIDYAAYHEKCD